jgi:hypothetical protein
MKLLYGDVGHKQTNDAMIKALIKASRMLQSLSLTEFCKAKLSNAKPALLHVSSAADVMPLNTPLCICS